jgi:hypothetical protein
MQLLFTAGRFARDRADYQERKQRKNRTDPEDAADPGFQGKADGIHCFLE